MSGRGVRVPLWVLGAGVGILGFLVGVAAVLLLRDEGPDAATALPVGPSTQSGEAPFSASPTVAPMHPASPFATAVPTRETATEQPLAPPTLAPTTAAVTSTPEVVAEPSPTHSPYGGLKVLSAGDGGHYGQGFPSGNCANWTIGLVNQSDTPITEVTFAPPDGGYTNFSGWDGADFPEVDAEPPEPAVIAIYLEPGGSQDVEFQTCTSTEPPEDTDFEFGVTAPEAVSFLWITGHEGSACFTC